MIEARSNVKGNYKDLFILKSKRCRRNFQNCKSKLYMKKLKLKIEIKHTVSLRKHPILKGLF